ncbi:velvet factor-domain-containing protein [Syncephalis plumigaleata]|nr:velvet factor-domain-containing protein [Syncephalis plumigaleata]
MSSFMSVTSESIEHDCEFMVFQQPQRARAANSKDATERRAVDPPPVLKLTLPTSTPVAEDCTKYIALAVLMPPTGLKDGALNDAPITPATTATHTSMAVGTWASAAYLLRSVEESEERDIFFIFPDLGVKRSGIFCIHFLLYERTGTTLKWLKSATSNPFTVYSARLFPGVLESTMLSRIFVSQGVKIRLRNSQHTENQLPLKNENNNNPRLLPGRYLLAPSGVPTESSRSSSNSISMSLSSRGASPIAPYVAGHYMPATECAFMNDKPGFISSVSMDGKTSYAKRPRLSVGPSNSTSPSRQARSMPYTTTVQEASINEGKERPIAIPVTRNRTFAKHQDILHHNNTTTTSATMTPSHSHSNTNTNTNNNANIACNPDNQSNGTRLPPISSLYLDDWPSSYDRAITPSSEYPPSYPRGSFRPVPQDVFLPRITPIAMPNRTDRPDTSSVHVHDLVSTREPTKQSSTGHFDSTRHSTGPSYTQQPPSHPEQTRGIIGHASSMHF